MKTIKILMLLGFYISAALPLKAQKQCTAEGSQCTSGNKSRDGAEVTAPASPKCYRPELMNAEQINTVKGIWKGNYDFNGKSYPMTVKLYTNSNITCLIDVPPVAGKETGEQIRFCGGGEFHFKKYVDDLSYEFQGTPKDGKMQGLLTVRKDDKKVGTNGRFTLSKVGGAQN